MPVIPDGFNNILCLYIMNTVLICLNFSESNYAKKQEIHMTGVSTNPKNLTLKKTCTFWAHSYQIANSINCQAQSQLTLLESLL